MKSSILEQPVEVVFETVVNEIERFHAVIADSQANHKLSREWKRPLFLTLNWFFPGGCKCSIFF
jgi:hypothetical protein